MAEGIFGGGGSVQWAVIVDDDEREDPVKKTTFTSRARGCRLHGVDKTHGEDFTIAIKVPGVTTGKDFVKWLETYGKLCVRGGAARFRLPIQNDNKQISVRWK